MGLGFDTTPRSDFVTKIRARRRDSMEEKILIEQLKALKTIHPRKEWVVLVKANILDSSEAVQRIVPFGMPFNIPMRRMAWSLAAFLLVVTGVTGYVGLGQPAQYGMASDVQALQMTSQQLANAVMTKEPQKIVIAVKAVQSAQKRLAQAISKYPGQAQSVAVDINNAKTYLDILGAPKISQLKESSDELYKVLDEQILADLKGASLTDEQKVMMEEAVDLYENRQYAQALEKILMVSSPKP